MTDLTFITPEDTEAWTLLWESLEAGLRYNAKHLHTGSDLAAEHQGEVWQYMGTVNGTVHEFRHRNHPKANGCRVYAKIQAPADTGDLWNIPASFICR